MGRDRGVVRSRNKDRSSKRPGQGYGQEQGQVSLVLGENRVGIQGYWEQRQGEDQHWGQGYRQGQSCGQGQVS